jgi:hypothetical protein
MDRVIAFAATGCSRDYAAECVAAIEAAGTAFHEAEEWLGRLDAVAGDGDHGAWSAETMRQRWQPPLPWSRAQVPATRRRLPRPTKPAERPVSSGAPGCAPW